MRKLLYIVALISLACGATSALPVVETTTAPVEVTETTDAPRLGQIVGSWNLREAPGEESPLITTLSDVKVKIISCIPAYGGEWCNIRYRLVKGWINKKGIIEDKEK